MTALISIFSLIFLYFIFREYKKHKKFPTLRATIYFEKPNSYLCHYEVFQNETFESEKTKLILHLISKIFNVTKDKKENLLIKLLLKSIANDGISSVLNKFNSQIFVTEGISKSSEKLIATLRYENAASRMILCKIPLNYYSGENKLFFSIIALLDVTYKKLSIDQKEILENSIKFMVRKYDEGANPKSFKTMHLLPNQAFFESI